MSSFPFFFSFPVLRRGGEGENENENENENDDQDGC